MNNIINWLSVYYKFASGKKLVNNSVDIELANKKLDFFVFANKYVEKMRADGRAKSASNYASTVGNLQKFLKPRERLNFNEITAAFCYKYHAWMAQSGLGQRGQELYLSCLRKIFNDAVLEYNDYDTGEILITVNPFVRFKIPTPVFVNNAERRALPVETIRQIFAYQPRTAREGLARDIYKLSFCLCGMNAADLYTCERFDIESKKLIYYRAKTKACRADGAEMQITIPQEVEHLFEKYRSNGSKRVFNFSEKYVNIDSFNIAVNSGGLRKIGEAVKVDRLTLYTARHSWATIAVNDLNIPEEQVDDCLAHAPVRKMLRRYVKKDWSKIDKANRKVLDYVLGGITSNCCRQLSLF